MTKMDLPEKNTTLMAVKWQYQQRPMHEIEDFHTDQSHRFFALTYVTSFLPRVHRYEAIIIVDFKFYFQCKAMLIHCSSYLFPQ